MAITRKPAAASAPVERRADDFISAAPDSAEPRRVRKGKKVQISLTISEPLLKRVDELAEQIGQSRAAVINLAIFQALDSGLSVSAAD